MECPFEECQINLSKANIIIEKDFRFIGYIAKYLKSGGYDVVDGKLPYKEAMRRIVERMKRQNLKEDLPIKHLESILTSLNPKENI